MKICHTGWLCFISIFIFQCLLHSVVATASPSLGIIKDFPEQDQEGESRKQVQSYTGRITFKESSKDSAGMYPPQLMSNATLLKFCVMAYNEMLTIFDGLQLDSSRLPGAMIAVAVGPDIWFASSMKGDFGAFYKGAMSNQGLKDEIFYECFQGSHSHNLACGEPNVLDNILASNGGSFPTVRYPRLAAWVRPTVRGSEVNARPCVGKAGGYGCQDLIALFGIVSIIPTTPDPADGSQWAGQFTIGRTPRQACQLPT